MYGSDRFDAANCLVGARRRFLKPGAKDFKIQPFVRKWPQEIEKRSRNVAWEKL